jgi:hypothetical protein
MTNQRRRLLALQLAFAGAAAVAVLAAGPVRLAESSPQYPQSAPAAIGSVFGSGGFAADDNDDQEAVQQAEQQAEEQNEAAEQQTQQDEQQGALDPSQVN